jgi:hypothetical protein
MYRGIVAGMAPWLGHEGSRTVTAIAFTAAAVIATVARRRAPRGLCGECGRFMVEPGDRCADCEADDFYRACAPLVGSVYPAPDQKTY